MKRARVPFLTSILLTAFWLAACSPRATTSSGLTEPAAGNSTATPNEDIFRPPDLQATLQGEIPAGEAFQPGALPTPACSDSLDFLNDLTIEDGTVVLPGAAIDKRWLVENNGTCNWDGRYHLRLISGEALGAPAEQALYPARAGTQAIIRMLLTAPTEPGTYHSAWQAYNPQGQAFEEPVYIEIVVSP